MSEYLEPAVTPAVSTPTGTAPAPTDRPPAAPPVDDPAPMKDRAADAAQASKGAAADVAHTASDKAKDVIGETKTQARNVVGEARGQLSEQAGAQHRNLVDKLQSLADELSSMSHTSEQSGVATDLVAQAGERARGVASWLDARQPGDLVEELRSFGRQRPGAFLAGALVLGVVAGRLTRGVVAVHGQDADDSDAGRSTQPVPVDDESLSTGGAGYSVEQPATDRNEFPPAGQYAPPASGLAVGGSGGVRP